MAKKWRCRICGYVVVGEKPPNICPVCGALENDFVEVKDEEEFQSSQAHSGNSCNKKTFGNSATADTHLNSTKFRVSERKRTNSKFGPVV